MKKSIRLVAFCCLAATLTACGTVAFTGRKQMLLYSDSEICALSEQSYKEFISSAKVSSRTADSKVLKEVGGRMTQALESYLESSGMNNSLTGLKWDYQLVASNEVNAFCMPSGKIVFYEGILKYADSPDYIAVVMGHEMAHAIARHGNERMSQQGAVNLIGSIAGAVIGSRKGDDAQALFNLGFNVGTQLGVILPYSRKHEYEADRIGLYLMAIAGYDINAAPKFWEKMSAGGSSSSTDFFSTHPCDSKRITALREALPEAGKYVRK